MNEKFIHGLEKLSESMVILKFEKKTYFWGKKINFWLKLILSIHRIKKKFRRTLRKNQKKPEIGGKLNAINNYQENLVWHRWGY